MATRCDPDRTAGQASCAFVTGYGSPARPVTCVGALIWAGPAFVVHYMACDREVAGQKSSDWA
jgi:hypothetical protein